MPRAGNSGTKCFKSVTVLLTGNYSILKCKQRASSRFGHPTKDILFFWAV
uniref:Uncharacterized protein n=1 Tax=Anguilla anguilla TaxID=7936 RepID=A0A0E9T0K3_ANGAN